MVVIRLARGGAKKRPFYHIVAADKRRARDGRFIERLGHFNPLARGADIKIQMNEDRVNYWRSVGAQLSDRVKSLIKKFHQQQALSNEAPKSAEPKATKPEKAESETVEAVKTEPEKVEPEATVEAVKTEPEKVEPEATVEAVKAEPEKVESEAIDVVKAEPAEPESGDTTKSEANPSDADKTNDQ